MTNQTKNSMLLMLCALIWGTAFVAQSAGSGMGAFSFLAGRSWMAVLVLLPTVKAFDALHHRQGKPDGKPKTAAERKLLLKAGLMCGTLLFLASAAAARHHAGPLHRKGGLPDRHVCGAGAGVRPVSGP